jgi:hypothetical protein
VAFARIHSHGEGNVVRISQTYNGGFGVIVVVQVLPTIVIVRSISETSDDIRNAMMSNILNIFWRHAHIVLARESSFVNLRADGSVPESVIAECMRETLSTNTPVHTQHLHAVANALHLSTTKPLQIDRVPNAEYFSRMSSIVRINVVRVRSAATLLLLEGRSVPDGVRQMLVGMQVAVDARSPPAELLSIADRFEQAFAGVQLLLGFGARAVAGGDVDFAHRRLSRPALW